MTFFDHAAAAAIGPGVQQSRYGGPGRWVMRGPLGGQPRDCPQCRYCGRSQSADCPPVNCQLCFTTQCLPDSGTGRCAVCYHGYLTGRRGATERQGCSHEGCPGPAVAAVLRIAPVGAACAFHASFHARVPYRGALITLLDRAKIAVSERDAGRPEWAGWVFLLDEVALTVPVSNQKESKK